MSNVRLSGPQALDNLIRPWINTKRIVPIINNFNPSPEEQHRLESTFGKIIYEHILELDKLTIDSLTVAPDIIFIDDCNKLSNHERNTIYHHFAAKKITYMSFCHMLNICAQNDSVLVVKQDSFKMCDIERENTYTDNFRNRYSCNETLKIIKNIANKKSVFHQKHLGTYKLFWAKYYFLVHCNNIWLYLDYFIKKLGIGFQSNDILTIIFQMMVQLFRNDTNREASLCFLGILVGQVRAKTAYMQID